MKLLSVFLCCLLPWVSIHAAEETVAGTDTTAAAVDHQPPPSDAASTAVAATPPTVPASAASSNGPAIEPSVDKEIPSMLRIGDAKLRQQDWESARLAYNQVLTADPLATSAQMRTALLGLARAYRGDLRLPQACAVYERYIKDYPGDEQLPIVYLELGRSLRALGAHRLAIARFYSVLNSTLKLPEQGSETYRQLALTAQFEIAETHFLSGDYDAAFRFYSRLRLLDLAPADRARAAFKAAYALNLKNDHEQAVTQLRAYLTLHPGSENAAEARNLLALALRRLGRSEESLAATLDLLKTEKTRIDAAPATWGYWQRKTGNQLANEFYEQGDINTALTIYQCLRDIGGPPEWLLPVKYQIGLCQERLHQPVLARATYRSILDSLRAPVGDTAKTPAVLQDIDTMVTWRLKHLDWLESTEKKSLLFTAPAGPSVSSDVSRVAPAISATP